MARNSENKKQKPLSLRRKLFRIGRYFFIGGISFVVIALVCVVSYGNYIARSQSTKQVTALMPDINVAKTEVAETPQFPIGVHPDKEEIIENPNAEVFFDTYYADNDAVLGMHTSWFGRALGKLALFGWYQNLASLSTRILVILPGERREQIADNFGNILGWNNTEKETFLTIISKTPPMVVEGKFYPGTYTVARGASPEEVAKLISDRFDAEILQRYGDVVEKAVPLTQALIMASLLEREAYDFEDMRHISGVIWNRLFTDMRLQIDATLQYAKGSKPQQPWWPAVRPADKYIESSYNTYEYQGLPPGAIANPSAEAILATLNPTKTDCMYYFHDKNAGFHCSKTYEEHVASLKQYYGKGK